MQFYTDPAREQDAHALPDAETFYISLGSRPLDQDGWPRPTSPGWYWRPWYVENTLVGRSSRSLAADPIGPFDTEALAVADAQGGVA